MLRRTYRKLVSWRCFNKYNTIAFLSSVRIVLYFINESVVKIQIFLIFAMMGCWSKQSYAMHAFFFLYEKWAYSLRLLINSFKIRKIFYLGIDTLWRQNEWEKLKDETMVLYLEAILYWSLPLKTWRIYEGRDQRNQLNLDCPFPI